MENEVWKDATRLLSKRNNQNIKVTAGRKQGRPRPGNQPKGQREKKKRSF
jgi:hypothetical protein